MSFKEVSIDLSKHDVVIYSKAGDYVSVKVDGEEVMGVRRILFDAPFIRDGRDLNTKTLKVLIPEPEGTINLEVDKDGLHKLKDLEQQIKDVYTEADKKASPLKEELANQNINIKQIY